MGGSAPGPDRQLPVETTSFVDRRGELAAGRELLARARLVTLTGPGGVGKTRLAVEAARAVRADFTDGAHFVSLAALDRHEDVPTAIAAKLEIIGLAGELPARAVERSRRSAGRRTPRRRYHTLPAPRSAKAKVRSLNSRGSAGNGGRQLFAFFSRNLMASPTVKMVSAASSGI